MLFIPAAQVIDSAKVKKKKERKGPILLTSNKKKQFLALIKNACKNHALF